MAGMEGTGLVFRTVETRGNLIREVYTYRNLDTAESSYSVSRTKQSASKTKKLRYNYKEISGRILRTKTSGGMTRVVAAARNRVALLRRRAGSGEYSEEDLRIAIVHAEKMVRIAKKKLKNLKSEELAEKTGAAADQAEEYEEENAAFEGVEEAVLQQEAAMSREEMQELMREMQQQMQEALEDMGMEELTGDILGGGTLSKEDLEAWKKKHRAEEMKAIIEADMKYLKAMFQRMQQEQQETAGEIAGSISLELGGMNVPVAASQAPVSIQGEAVDVSV